MKVIDHNKYRLFDYNNHPNDNFELGQIVINVNRDDGNPIGVVIQTHDDGDCRTDMFGNCGTEEVRLATIEEVKEFRKELLKEIELTYEDFSKEMQNLCDKYAFRELDYDTLAIFKREAEAIGYTFEYYLDARPFNFKLLNNE